MPAHGCAAAEVCENLPVELALSSKPGRLFKRSAELKKLCRRGMRDFRFYLFSDLILYCRDELGFTHMLGFKKSQVCVCVSACMYVWMSICVLLLCVWRCVSIIARCTSSIPPSVLPILCPCCHFRFRLPSFQGDVSAAGRRPNGVSYRAINLKQTAIEPAPFKYPNAFMLRSPAKSFVVQCPDEATRKLWEQGACAVARV